jgi:hypothetical protein
MLKVEALTRSGCESECGRAVPGGDVPVEALGYDCIDVARIISMEYAREVLSSIEAFLIIITLLSARMIRTAQCGFDLGLNFANQHQVFIAQIVREDRCVMAEVERYRDLPPPLARSIDIDPAKPVHKPEERFLSVGALESC